MCVYMSVCVDRCLCVYDRMCVLDVSICAQVCLDIPAQRPEEDLVCPALFSSNVFPLRQALNEPR